MCHLGTPSHRQCIIPADFHSQKLLCAALGWAFLNKDSYLLSGGRGTGWEFMAWDSCLEA